jgi:hypothetical protein
MRQLLVLLWQSASAIDFKSSIVNLVMSRYLLLAFDFQHLAKRGAPLSNIIDKEQSAAFGGPACHL